jgi:hypothetical protein
MSAVMARRRSAVRVARLEWALSARTRSGRVRALLVNPLQ